MRPWKSPAPPGPCSEDPAGDLGSDLKQDALRCYGVDLGGRLLQTKFSTLYSIYEFTLEILMSIQFTVNTNRRSDKL